MKTDTNSEWFKVNIKGLLKIIYESFISKYYTKHNICIDLEDKIYLLRTMLR